MSQNIKDIIERNMIRNLDLSLNKQIIPQCILSEKDEIKTFFHIEDTGFCSDINVSVQSFKENVEEIFKDDENISQVHGFLDLLIDNKIDNLIY